MIAIHVIANERVCNPRRGTYKTLPRSHSLCFLLSSSTSLSFYIFSHTDFTFNLGMKCINFKFISFGCETLREGLNYRHNMIILLMIQVPLQLADFQAWLNIDELIQIGSRIV